MSDLLLANEGLFRGAVALAALIAMAVWEFAAPRRAQTHSRWLRWPNNVGIAVINSLLVRLLFPAVAVGLAVMAENRGWGLLNVFTPSPSVALITSVLALDLTIYLQHVMFHAVPALWRIHRMHHADQEFDATTGVRFHPVEIVLSMGIKFLAIAALGPPATAVLVFEILLNAVSIFNHGNARIPLAADRVLRWLVVTPDMHRVHHSIDVRETNSNFGFNLPWWDRLLGTYRDQPQAGHERMTLGLEQFRTPRDLWLHCMLAQPLRRSAQSPPSL